MTLLIEISILTGPYFSIKMASWKYHRKLMNCLLIGCELFSSSFQMGKKKKYDVFKLLYTKLNINDNINIIYGNVTHECDKDL